MSLYTLELGLKFEPENTDICYNLGIAHARLGNYKKATEVFKWIACLNPNDADVQYALGKLNRRIGNDEEAVKAYK